MAPIPNPPSPARQTRRDPLDKPVASALALPPAHRVRIDRSHERCAALGLSRIELPDFQPLGRSDLGTALDRNRRLSSHAAPLMEMLFDQIAGTQSMVVLCDDTGTIIHSVGDDDFLARASKVALQPGVNWSEGARGTNAIGTALIEEVPTLVHADEHFLHANHFLTCSAAPILDPRGNILGVLDVTGDQRSYHQHTMALVRMSARMIENHWLADDFGHVMRLHFHRRADTIGTLMEGILAVSPDGRIVGANRSALEQLGLSGAALRMHGLLSLFGTTVGALVDRFRSPLAAPLTAQAATGGQFHLHARFNWPVWSHVTEAVAAAPSASALAAWLTGDAAVARVVGRVRRVLDSGIAVFIGGETGTGKATLARAMHQDSARSLQPFTPLDAAPAGPLHGTLYIDEVADLTAPQQVRVLQLLQDPGLGVISASRRTLADLVAAGSLRDDLQFRLTGLAVTLPPLRERSDLPALVQQMLDTLSGGRPLRLADEVAALLASLPWPGNLRQLNNLLRCAAALTAEDGQITFDHLPDDLRTGTAPAPLQSQTVAAIRRAVDQAGGNIALAARQLGVSRNTIYRKLR